MNTWILEYLNTWILEYLTTWLLDYLTTWLLDYLTTWILEYLSTWVLEYLSTWVLEYLSTQFFGFHWILWKFSLSKHIINTTKSFTQMKDQLVFNILATTEMEKKLFYCIYLTASTPCLVCRHISVFAAKLEWILLLVGREPVWKIPHLGGMVRTGSFSTHFKK